MLKTPSVCPPLHRLSSRLFVPARGRDAVFSLMVRANSLGQVRVAVRWEVLPIGAEGIGGRELALLAVAAMGASNFRLSLNFQIVDDHVVIGRAPVEHGDDEPAGSGVGGIGTVAGLAFDDFQFEDVVSAVLHGLWKVSARQAPLCDERKCTVGDYVATFRHDTSKVKNY
jgi:hypothetical protein